MPDIATILVKGGEELGIELPPRVVDAYLFYLSELQRWNRKINLTSLRTDQQIAVKHFLDSLTVAPFLPATGRILDIGTGAGFPGLPLKILLPSLELILLEASRKKCTFLRHIIRGLRLQGVEVVHGRAQDKGIIERYSGLDMVTTRAVADIMTVLKLALPFVRKGGRIVCMRGRKGEQELAAIDLGGVGVQLSEKQRLSLPFVNEVRFILIFARIL